MLFNYTEFWQSLLRLKWSNYLSFTHLPNIQINNYFLFEHFIDIFGSHKAKLLIFTVSNSIYGRKIPPRTPENPKQPKA